MQAQRALVAMGLGPRCTSEPAKVLPRARRLPSASVWLQVCPCDPHNGKKRRAAAVKPAGRASDAQLLALLRDARRPRAAEGFSECCLALQQLSVRGGRAGSSCADQAAVTCAQPSAV